MKNLLLALSIVIICSDDKGLTQTVFEHVHHIYYAEQCLIFSADKVKDQMAVCDPKAECVITEGRVMKVTNIEKVEEPTK